MNTGNITHQGDHDLILATARQVDHGSLSDATLADTLHLNNLSNWDF